MYPAADVEASRWVKFTSGDLAALTSKVARVCLVQRPATIDDRKTRSLGCEQDHYHAQNTAAAQREKVGTG